MPVFLPNHCRRGNDDNRKYPQPSIHESTIELRGYDGDIRQIIIRVTGKEKPAFLITNDSTTPAEFLVGQLCQALAGSGAGDCRGGQVFHLNVLSSPILIKIHFDVVMTMIVYTLNSRLAQQLRGFEECNAPKTFRNFVKGGGDSCCA